MRSGIVAIIVVGWMVALPLGVAQEGVPTMQEPVDTHCRADPPLENCDPKQANEAAHGQRLILPDDNLPVRTILYAHYLTDILQQAPLNTQFPNPDREIDLDRGFTMPTVYVAQEGAPCCKFPNNEFKLFSTAGLIEYLPDGFRVHQEPGLAEPVEIVPIDGEYVYLYWYMSPEIGPQSVAADRPGVVPALGVYAKMNLGRFPSDDSRLLIAEGDTGSGYQSETPFADNQCSECVTLVTRPGESDPVYEFKVPLKLERTTIPDVRDPAFSDKEKGYVLQVIPYQLEQEKVRVTQADWRLRTGPEYAPRLVLDVDQPLVTKSTRIHTFAEGLFFRWSFNSVWGTYDVDVNSLDIRIDGPKKLGPAELELVKIKYSFDHDGHFKPINVTWRYDFVNQPLPAGEYTVSAMVHNLQDTYMLDWTDTFTVDAQGVPQVEDLGGGLSGGDPASRVKGGGQPSGDSPGPTVAALVLACAVAAYAAMRRDRD